MKSCPKCKRSFDNSLDFCLEDGTPLVSLPIGSSTITVESNPAQTASPTVAYPIAPIRKAAGDLSRAAKAETIIAKNEILGRDGIPRSSVVLEYAAITIALAHNWWQWLYLEKQYLSSILDYLLSANFLMWLLLLGGGTAVSLIVVRKSERKILGVLSLVILAVNLILFLVPKR